MTTVRYPLRMPAETLAALKDAHARTFEQHRLSFHKWMLDRISGEMIPHYVVDHSLAEMREFDKEETK